MAQSFVQTASAIGTSNFPISVAYGSNNALGNLLFCTVCWFHTYSGGTDSGVVTVSDTNGAWTALPIVPIQGTPSAGNAWMQSFYKLKCAAGANTVTAANATAAISASLIIGEWSGVDTLDQHVEHSGNYNVSPDSGNVITGHTDICIGYAGMWGTATWDNSQDTSYTVRSANNAVVSFSSKENIASGTFGFTDHYSQSVANDAAGLATFYQSQPSGLGAPIALVGSATTSGTSSPWGIPYTATAGNLLVCFARCNAGAITDANNTWTIVAQMSGRGNIWYVAGCHGGLNWIQIPYTTGWEMIVLEYSGVMPGAAQDQFTYHNVGSLQTTNQTGSIMPTQKGELVISYSENDYAYYPNTVDSGMTVRATIGTSFVADLVQTSAAAINPTWTSVGGATQYWNAGVVSFFSAAPIGWWKLDDGGGTSAIDSSGYADTGILNGTA